MLFPSEQIDNPSDLITKGSHVATIIQCGGIWISDKKYGVTWKLFQAVVKPRETLSGKCHITLSTDEKEKLEKPQEILDEEEEEIVELPKTVEEKAKVDDSDDEDKKEEVVEMADVEPEPDPEPEAQHTVVEDKLKPVEVEDKPKPKKVVKKAAPKK